MAATAMTYFESGRGWDARIAERNAALMATQIDRRRRVRTPEYFFVKHFDNSRLVKAADPVRARQMRYFSIAVGVFFLLVMFYGLQHFSAIENSYRIEGEKQALEQLREENRQLRLDKAELTQPSRIDQMARELGLNAPQPGQVVHSSGHSEANSSVLAQVTPPAQ